jgi:uncharacterized protein YoxC
MMRIQLLGLAFCAVAIAAPFNGVETSDSSKKMDVSKATKDVNIDDQHLHNAVVEILGETSNLIPRDVENIKERGVNGLLSGLLGSVNGLVGQVEKLLHSTLKGVDPSLAKTVRSLLKEVTGLVESVKDVVDGVLSSSEITALLDQVNALVGKVDGILVDVLKDGESRHQRYWIQS